MGISVLPTRYRINGVLSTDATVMQNMETLARAAQSWFTYDVNLGKWAVIINTTGNSIASFDDSNITGPVSISGTGLGDLYNRVRVEFPHIDLDDQVDFVEVAIPAEDRNANEPDNTLNISFDVINDPVMAEMLGLIELKQSRVDKVIRFTTDYSYIGLKAGDLIDVTNSVLGYTNKVFRIISIEEADDEAISISITATEYDANVYDTSDLFRYERSNENGIVTIGSIDTPTAPTITATTLSSRPRLNLSTTVPSGLVSGMEFWLSENNENFVLLSTERPQNGGNFAFGDTVSYEYDKVVTGNLIARVRAVNDTTTSLYSFNSVLNNFVPKQVTDAIGTDTEILDEDGNAIATQLGISLALAALDGFLGGNEDAFTEAFSSRPTVALFNTPFEVSGANCVSKLNAMASGYTTENGYSPSSLTNRNNWITIPFQLSSPVAVLTIDIQTPTVFFDYEFLDRTGNVRTATSFVAQPPLGMQIYTGNTLANAVVVNDVFTTIDWNANYNKIIQTDLPAGNYYFVATLIPTYDLDMYWPRTGVLPQEYNSISPINFSQAGQSLRIVVNASNPG
jgi:hypothetical protein